MDCLSPHCYHPACYKNAAGSKSEKINPQVKFIRTLFEYCEFICSNSDQTPGILTETCHASQGFLSFLGLVGCAYFRKHRSSFLLAYPTPMTLFHSTANSQQTALKNHSAWLEFLKERIWSRIKYEEEMIPSTEALYRHCKRARVLTPCGVLIARSIIK